MNKDTHVTVLDRIRKLPKDKDGYVKRIDVIENNAEKRRAVNDMVVDGYIEERLRVSDNENVLRIKTKGVDFLKRNQSSIANAKFNKYRIVWIVVMAVVGVMATIYVTQFLTPNQEEQKLKELKQTPQDNSKPTSLDTIKRLDTVPK